MLASNALTHAHVASSLKEPELGNTPTFNEYMEGSVLLSSDGRIIKLNSIGSIVWEILYSNESVGGAAEPLLLTQLAERFEQLQISFTEQSILNDLNQFLNALKTRRLISVVADASGASFFRVLKDTVWSGQLHRQYPRVEGQPITTRIRKTNFKKFMTLRALSWLLAYSFLLKTGGFRRIRRIVEPDCFQSSKTRDKNFEKEVCRQICTAVDRAQTFLLRQALCLQRSIVITRLLHNHGICAETVIAAHLMPFKSHAWVEIDGEVVSDSANVKRYYDVVVERLG